MSSVGMGFGCLVLGGGTLVNWWFEMFSDCGYAQLCRSIMSQGGFYLGRNTIALIEPAIGGFFLFSGCGMLVDSCGIQEEFISLLLFGGALLSVVLFAVGLIPFRLPAPMYPEWQMEKRRARAEAAARDAGMDDELTQSTGRHAAEPRKPGPSRGPGRHAK